jgi:hypothetical protein
MLGMTAAAQAESPLAKKIADTGKVVIGYANEAPYGFATPDGQLTGEAPEIAKHILGQMGVKEVEGVITEFGSLIPGLNAGRFDIIAAGMFILPQRCQQITFSEPTYGIGQSFLIKAGNPEDIHNYDDVAATSDVTLAVMAGAVEGEYAQKSGVPMSQLLVVPDKAAGPPRSRPGEPMPLRSRASRSARSSRPGAAMPASRRPMRSARSRARTSRATAASAFATRMPSSSTSSTRSSPNSSARPSILLWSSRSASPRTSCRS